MKRCFLTVLCSCLTAINSFSQAGQATHNSGFQPVRSNVSGSNILTPATQTQSQQAIRGGHANDLITRPNQSGYDRTSQQEEQRHLLQSLQEEEYRRELMTAPARQKTKDFYNTLQYLTDMLAGKKTLSIAEAYFAVENAYGNCYLTKQEYDNIIFQSVDFIKTWIRQNGLDLKNNYHVHYAIKQFLSESLTITENKKGKDLKVATQSVTHLSFFYDFNDYLCAADMRNSFVTKCLATGFGQCASMPVVYLILAEKLGVKAYLSTAPQHSFIKHPDDSGHIRNYEPTSNWELSDKWYKEWLFISARAVNTGLHLDTLNSKQVVANCIFNLALLSIKADLVDRDNLILDCLNAGNPYFPRRNNLLSLSLQGMYFKKMLSESMSKHYVKISNIEKVPEVKAYRQKYLENEAFLTNLGYQDIPEGMYEEMLKEHEFKGRMQEQLNISGKEKRNLFIKTKQ